ncbi:MAG: Ig-like domain-containing protein [Oceanihabitans sp.]
MKKKYALIILFLAVIGFVSCSSDDGNYVALEMETNPDLVSVVQNSTITISIYNNDNNIPTNGSLTTSLPTNGELTITDPNNTPNNPSDNVLSYTPQANFTGSDSFTYTICNSESPQMCKTETVSITITSGSPVVFDASQVPYATLSEYHFFEGDIKDQNPAFGVIPYEPISTLFTDYAHKKRFIWMPNNTVATYGNDYDLLNFPDGTILIKSFYYNNVQPSGDTKIIETRLMIKQATGWEFANYIWNDAQTEATYDLSGGTVSNLQFIDNGVTRTINYEIPPESDCFTCHKNAGISKPIGPEPQNLNKDFPFATGVQNQLQKLVDIGYLNEKPATINTVVNWEDTTQSLDLRVRSYLDINCAHCHTDLGHCDYRPMRLAFNESDNETNLGVCVEPEENVSPFIKIVLPGNISKSMLHFRLSTTQEQYKMPLIGRSIVHEEAVQLIEDWINSLTTTCP